jgi:hypothetical protein
MRKKTGNHQLQICDTYLCAKELEYLKSYLLAIKEDIDDDAFTFMMDRVSPTRFKSEILKPFGFEIKTGSIAKSVGK